MGEDMGGLPASGDSSQGRASREAKEHLDQAVDAMSKFEERLADERYGSGDRSSSDGMTDLADSAVRRLAEASQAIRKGLGSERGGPLDEARRMAEQLAKDAQTYDESLTEAEKEKMQDRLKAAERLLESMAGAQWTSIFGGGGPGASHTFTQDPHTSPGDAARLMAQQFWSMALQEKSRRSLPVEQESSGVEFFEAETQFFEKAAKFGTRDGEK